MCWTERLIKKNDLRDLFKSRKLWIYTSSVSKFPPRRFKVSESPSIHFSSAINRIYILEIRPEKGSNIQFICKFNK